MKASKLLYPFHISNIKKKFPDTINIVNEFAVIEELRGF